MVQRRCCFGFPLESAESLCVVGEFVGKELQGDVATELEVFRLVDHAHPSPAYLAEDAVMGNLSAQRVGTEWTLAERCYGEAGRGSMLSS